MTPSAHLPFFPALEHIINTAEREGGREPLTHHLPFFPVILSFSVVMDGEGSKKCPIECHKKCGESPCLDRDLEDIFLSQEELDKRKARVPKVLMVSPL